MSAPSPGETFPEEHPAGRANGGSENARQTAEDSTRATAARGEAESPLSKVWRSLWSSEPHEPLEAINSPLGPSRGSRRLWRGIKKMGGSDDMPALVDIVWGAAEMYLETQQTRADPGHPNQAADAIDGMTLPDGFGEGGQE